MHVISRHRSKQELDVLGSSLFSFFSHLHGFEQILSLSSSLCKTGIISEWLLNKRLCNSLRELPVQTPGLLLLFVADLRLVTGIHKVTDIPSCGPWIG